MALVDLMVPQALGPPVFTRTSGADLLLSQETAAKPNPQVVAAAQEKTAAVFCWLCYKSGSPFNPKTDQSCPTPGSCEDCSAGSTLLSQHLVFVGWLYSHSQGEVRRGFWRSAHPTPCSEGEGLEQLAQGCVQPALECP